MQILTLDCLGKPLRLEASMAGWQALYWDGQRVSQVAASAEPNTETRHQFSLQADEHTLLVTLDITLSWQPFVLRYQLRINDEAVAQGERVETDIEQQSVADKPKAANKISLIGLGSLALKLFKSAKVIKVLFAAGRLAAYSWLFSLEFRAATFTISTYTFFKVLCKCKRFLQIKL